MARQSTVVCRSWLGGAALEPLKELNKKDAGRSSGGGWKERN